MVADGFYHIDTIFCHVLEHLVKNGVHHVIVGLGDHETHRSRIQIWGVFIRGEQRFLYDFYC